MRLYALTKVVGGLNGPVRVYWSFSTQAPVVESRLLTHNCLMELDIIQVTLKVFRNPDSTHANIKWEVQAFDIVPAEICYTAPVEE